MEEYKIVWSSSFQHLENEISVYLKNGYELHEGLQYFPVQKIGGVDNVFCQVLVKTKIKKEGNYSYCVRCQKELDDMPIFG